MKIKITENQLKFLIEGVEPLYQKFADSLKKSGWSDELVRASVNNVKEDISNDLGSKKSKYEGWLVKWLIDYIEERGDTEIYWDLIDLVKEFDKSQNRLTYDNILISLSGGEGGTKSPSPEWFEWSEKIKNAPKDINSYSPKILADVLENLPESKRAKSKKLTKEVVKIYEDDNLLVIRPMTKEASCKYGANTKWCTSGRLDNRFSHHFDDGLLVYYIVKPSVNLTYETFRKMASYQSMDDQYEYIWYDSKDDVMKYSPTSPFTKIPKKVKDSITKAITTLEDLYAYGKMDYDDYDEWGNTDW
jgi:hypothetical protein